MKRITWFIISILCIAACKDEIVISKEKGQNNMPSIELRIPEGSLVTYSTATPNECWINKLWVIEFTSTNVIRAMQLIDGSDIYYNGQAVQLLPQLKTIPLQGSTIVCIANSDAVIYPHPDSVYINLNNLSDYFPIEQKPFYTEADSLPMFGKIENWGDITSSYTCEMTRAVAKIQIQMGESVDDVTGSFNYNNVTYAVYNSAISGLIEPQSPVNGKPSLISHHSGNFHLLQNPDNTNVYIHEFAAGTKLGVGGGAIANNVFDPDRQHIILTNNVDGIPSYYRLDFINPLTNLFLDTERNFHYLFTINKVHSKGYQTLSEAQNNPGSNIEYTINVSDGGQPTATRTISNGQYAILIEGSFVDDTITFTGPSGGGSILVKDLVASYQLPGEMSSGLAPGTRNEITLESISPSTAFTAITPTTLSTTPSGFTVTVTSGTPGNSIGRITFHLGNISYRIYIKYVISS